MKQIIGKIKKADEFFGLFNDGDKIMIGISGGKDSMLLAAAMIIYKKVLKEAYNKNVDFIAGHVMQNFCIQDYDALKNHFKEVGLEFHLFDSDISTITMAKRDKAGRISCSLCSKLRKGILVDHALKLGCNKIAMGHHGDDAVETLIMNMTRGGRIATYEPLMHLDRKDIYLIRPLAFVREKEIISEVKRLNLLVSDCGCPNMGYTERDLIRQRLNKFYDKSDPTVYKNLLGMIWNEDGVNLWKKKKD